MEGTSSKPIIIDEDEILPDAPAAPSTIPSPLAMSSGQSQSRDQSRDHSLSSALSSSAISFDLLPAQTKFRGRKLGDGAGMKRKATDELSDNKHTKKGRERKQQMSELECEIERGKNADRQAKARIKKSVMKTTEYQAASPATQKRLLEEAEIKLMNQRYVAINVTISV
jgi:hypothetical protein